MVAAPRSTTACVPSPPVSTQSPSDVTTSAVVDEVDVAGGGVRGNAEELPTAAAAAAAGAAAGAAAPAAAVDAGAAPALALAVPLVLRGASCGVRRSNAEGKKTQLFWR